jgi:hypothetical protein
MTPGQLVKAVALAMDVSEETVVVHDRNLVAAGLRTKGGRGASAAKVTPQDAARLFVAVLASVKVKDSVEMVRAFEQLRLTPPPHLSAEIAALSAKGAITPEVARSGSSKEKPSDQAILSLPADHNLVDAIAALISDASLPAADIEQYLKRFAPLVVTCETPWTSADIYRMGQGSIARYYQVSRSSSSKDADKPMPPRHERYASVFGLRQRRDAYGTAIILLGKAFRDDGLDFETPRDAMYALLCIKKATKSKKKAA